MLFEEAQQQEEEQVEHVEHVEEAEETSLAVEEEVCGVAEEFNNKWRLRGLPKLIVIFSPFLRFLPVPASCSRRCLGLGRLALGASAVLLVASAEVGEVGEVAEEGEACVLRGEGGGGGGGGGGDGCAGLAGAALRRLRVLRPFSAARTFFAGGKGTGGGAGRPLALLLIPLGVSSATSKGFLALRWHGLASLSRLNARMTGRASTSTVFACMCTS